MKEVQHLKEHIRYLLVANQESQQKIRGVDMMQLAIIDSQEALGPTHQEMKLNRVLARA